jgi:hypothetical protein
MGDTKDVPPSRQIANKRVVIRNPLLVVLPGFESVHAGTGKDIACWLVDMDVLSIQPGNFGGWGVLFSQPLVAGI